MDNNTEIKIIKEEHHWTSDEKLKHCGYGEWVEEADVMHFEYLGYEACVLRVFKREPYAKFEAYFGGHLCGYVKIPSNHPYFRKEDIELECHGGVTFNETHEEHWIGFDCSHIMDRVPTMEHLRNTRPELIEIRKKYFPTEVLLHHPLFNPVYRNMGFCIEGCKELIDQLSILAKVDSCK